MFFTEANGVVVAIIIIFINMNGVVVAIIIIIKHARKNCLFFLVHFITQFLLSLDSRFYLIADQATYVPVIAIINNVYDGNDCNGHMHASSITPTRISPINAFFWIVELDK